MKLVTTKNVADENDEESDSESEAKVATPDQILEEPNTDEADLLHLLYASASSHDMSKADLRLHTLKGWDAHTEDSSRNVQLLPVAQLDPRPAVPSDTAEAIGLNFEGICFLMLPKTMWVKVADESNDFQRWQHNFSPVQLTEWNWRRRARNPAFRSKSSAQRLQDMSRFKEIKPHELVNFIELVCAGLCPHRGRLSRRWARYAQGAVPKGTFGKFMARRRFEEIVRHLHFSRNDDLNARRAKTWKIKPVADAIDESFITGMTAGPRLSFDEGMIPMRSRFNPMRQYLKAKPHPWGIKCYLTCDSETGYCYRVEIYQGRDANDR
ncbi:hypothetical protein PC110_g15225 [Phytophthora cactorum]|uniref:PiggyBac transposable element-derived protein domain-containing protein n=1 Tax=Phytophthora cactorum TaxID=29920 RepID=A0A329RVS0_9STRA|nr:hypothetical protein PC110_g15225 [Phytophthora cactorum]